MEILWTIFLICFSVSMFAAMVCLITPRVAFFLRKKTRPRAIFSWLGIGCVFFVLMMLCTPAELREAAKQKSVAAEQAKTLARAEKARLVPYREIEVDDTSVGGRKRGSVRIVLADPAADFRPQDLAATCMAAAKFYAKEQGFKTVSVFFTDIPGERPHEGTQIARCHYASDKKGFGAGEGWEWNDVRVAERHYTDQERQVKQLWGGLSAQGMKGDAAIQKAIGKKLGIPAEKVATPPYILGLNEVDERPFKDVEPQGPEK